VPESVTVPMVSVVSTLPAWPRKFREAPARVTPTAPTRSTAAVAAVLSSV